ncbi:uncharacterized protein LOC115075979 isoform X1 [Rhinatrema bivittatum]|uniref:uncharacterized protein LOC115075979 isoform X1 n=1 Tax=Rhinatrema bivittatum TaxID=194408 RepID=UPI0011284511|nr:uncharacterized protein LOC115075979 isoform X1 [Rhinatrema bivittatum]
MAFPFCVSSLRADRREQLLESGGSGSFWHANFISRDYNTSQISIMPLISSGNPQCNRKTASGRGTPVPPKNRSKQQISILPLIGSGNPSATEKQEHTASTGKILRHSSVHRFLCSLDRVPRLPWSGILLCGHKRKDTGLLLWTSLKGNEESVHGESSLSSSLAILQNTGSPFYKALCKADPRVQSERGCLCSSQEFAMGPDSELPGFGHWGLFLGDQHYCGDSGSPKPSFP